VARHAQAEFKLPTTVHAIAALVVVAFNRRGLSWVQIECLTSMDSDSGFDSESRSSHYSVKWVESLSSKV